MEMRLGLGDIRKNTCVFLVAKQFIEKGYVRVGHDLLKLLFNYVSLRPQDQQNQWLLAHIRYEFRKLKEIDAYTDELQIMTDDGNDLNLNILVVVDGYLTTTSSTL
jgi:hypothetical protein